MKLNRFTKHEVKVGDILRLYPYNEDGKYIVTNVIKGTNRYGDAGSVSFTIQSMKTKQTIYAYPSSQLYGAEIIPAEEEEVEA